jgi:hypothetical protein
MSTEKHILKAITEPRYVAIAVVVNVTIGIVGVLFSFFYYKATGVLNDFYGYYHAGELVKNGQIDLLYVYVLNLEGITYIYRYFPAFACCMVPLSSLDYGTAYLIFSCISIACNVLMAIEVMRITRRLARDYSALILFLLLPFSLWTYIIGQNVIIASYFVALSLRHMMETKWVKSGILLGASMVFKPISAFVALLVLLWLLIIRKRAELVRFVLAFVIILLPDVAIFILNRGLLTSFIDSSVKGVDMRQAALSISAASFFYYVFDVHFIFILVPNVLVTSYLLMTRVKRAPFEKSCVSIFGAGILLHITSMIDIWPTQLAVLVILTPLLAPAYRSRINQCLIAISVAVFLVPFLFNIRTQLPLVFLIDYAFLLILAIFWYYWLLKISLTVAK